MKSYLVLSVTVAALIIVANANCDEPAENCNDLCFCPCIPPGGGTNDVIFPPTKCLELIKCAHTPECTAQIIACQKPQPTELCFCPCRLPFCGPDKLYYPSLSCLQKIKCTYGASECSAEYINGRGK